jgi:hypothetical protein
MLRMLTCAALFSLPLFCTTSFAGAKKSYQECRDLAVSRGLARMRVRDTRDLRPEVAQRTQPVLSLAAWRAFRTRASRAASIG